MSYNLAVYLNLKGEIVRSLDEPSVRELKEAANLALEKAEELGCFFFMVHLCKGAQGDETMSIYKLTKGSNNATQIDNWVLDTPSYKKMKEALQTIKLLKG